MLLSLSTGALVWAQGTAQVHGTVQDATGAAVPGAEVRVTQTETNTARTVSSGADCSYVLVNPLGPYQIAVTQPGFTRYDGDRLRLASCFQRTLFQPLRAIILASGQELPIPR